MHLNQLFIRNGIVRFVTVCASALTIACTEPETKARVTDTDISDTDTDTDSDTDSDTDTDTDSDTDSDTDTDTQPTGDTGDTDSPVDPDSTDDDGDGFCEVGPCTDVPAGNDGDCDDSDEYTFPGAAPNDSAGACMTDADDDDYGDNSPDVNVIPGTDCKDADEYTFPGAAEIESLSSCRTDADNDGYGDDTPTAGVNAGGDCNDNSSAISPVDQEIPDDGIDQDCDGTDDHVGGGGNECAQYDDNGDDIVFWDADCDAHGNGNLGIDINDPSSDCSNGCWADDGADCDEGDASVWDVCQPPVDECEQYDRNGDTVVFWDADCDGHGNGAIPVDIDDPFSDCSNGCWTDVGDDCDEGDASEWSACDGINDNGCEDVDDDGDNVVYYDNDCDGHGNALRPADADDEDTDCTLGCWDDDADDCRDDDATVWEDCEGELPEYTFYEDDDGDGYGDQNDNGTGGYTDPVPPDGMSDNRDDCDDNDADVHPGMTEIPDNGIDDNCRDGDAHESDDDDGDGWAVDEGDCRDDDALINPSMAELMDIRDNDCDGAADDEGLETLYRCFIDHSDRVLDIDNNGASVTYQVMQHWYDTSSSCTHNPLGGGNGVYDGHWIEIYPTNICTDSLAPVDGCVDNGDGTIGLWSAYELAGLSQCAGITSDGLYETLVLQEDSNEYVAYNFDPDFTCDRLGYVPAVAGAAIDDLRHDEDGADPLYMWTHAAAPFYGAAETGTPGGDVMYSLDDNEGGASYPVHIEYAFAVLYGDDN